MAPVYAPWTSGVPEQAGAALAVMVLVHGAFQGSYAFRPIRRELQQRGHEVFTPSLTGLGERVHLASPQITLTTHVQDVVNTVLYEDLHDIVLLGYSYGGAVVTAAMDHVGDRVRHLVFVDAMVPRDGQTPLELVGMPRPSITLGAPLFMPVPPRSFQDSRQADFENARRVPHPIATGTQPVRISMPLEKYACTRTYVRATLADPEDLAADHFAAMAAFAKESEDWEYREVATDHLVFANRPDAVVSILSALVQPEETGTAADS